MVNYSCNNCFKNFSRKSDFIYHTEQKKRPCRSDLQEFAESDIKTGGGKTEKVKEDNECTYCLKCFSSVYTLNRHLDNNCKVKKQQEEEINNIKTDKICDLKKEIVRLKKILKNNNINF